MQLTNTLLVSLLAATGAQASMHRGPMFSRAANETASAEPVAELAELVAKLEKEGKIKWTNTPSGAQMAEVPEAVIKEAATPTKPAMGTGTGAAGSTGTVGTAAPKKTLPAKHVARSEAPLPGASGTPDKLSIAGLPAKLTCAKPKDEHLSAGVEPATLLQPATVACQEWAAAAASSAGTAAPTSTGTAVKAGTAYHLWRPKAQPAPAIKAAVKPGQPDPNAPAQTGALVWYQSLGAAAPKLTPEMCTLAVQTLADPQKSKCTGKGHSASISMAVGGVATLGDKTKGINIGVNAMDAKPATAAPLKRVARQF